jgi:hypothetical protein
MFRNIYISKYIDKAELSKKSFLFLIALFLILYFYISTKIIWVLYLLLLTIVTLSRMKFVYKPIIILSILLIPLLWGSFMSFNGDLYHNSQGFFYLSIPLLLISIGFQFSNIFTIKQFLSFVLVIGTIISLLFIIVALFKIGFSAFKSPYTEARFILGSGSPACVLSLVISLFADKFGFDFFKNIFRKYLSILISLAAIYLFASRTYWVMLILFIAVFSVKTIKTDKLLISIVLLISFILIFINIHYSNDDLSFSNSLFYKLTHSFNEIALNNFYSDKDINLNYRGYEAYMAWKTYSQGNIPELIFGQGFGKLVNLNAEVLLAGKFWTQVPIIHNGFFYILLKTGALGLLFNLIFFFFFAMMGLRKYSSKDIKQQFLGVIVLACGLSLFMTNFVICGLFNFESSILLITTGFVLSNN